MSRPSLRRTPILEGLETRQVLSAVVGPTAAQQYALQLVNFVRTDPSAAATMFVNNITPDVQNTLNHYGLTEASLVNELNAATPQPPLAWSDSLGASAQAQSQYEANTGTQTHQGPGQNSLGGRISAAGYNNASSYGENTYAWANNTDEAMLSFLFDWGVADHGHYNNIMQPGVSAQNAYKDVGIGLVNTSNSSVGPLVITQDFGAQQNEGPQIVGVVFNDPNNTGFYAPGQGQAGVTITAVNQTTGQTFQTTSFGSGGYKLAVAPNSAYQVTAVENGHVISSQTVNVSDVNASADFIHNPANDLTPVPAPTPAPVTPTPAPAPVLTPTVGSPVIPMTVRVAAPQLLMSIPTQLEATPTQPIQAPVATPAPATPTWLSGWSRWTASKQATN